MAIEMKRNMLRLTKCLGQQRGGIYNKISIITTNTKESYTDQTPEIEQSKIFFSDLQVLLTCQLRPASQEGNRLQEN